MGDHAALEAGSDSFQRLCRCDCVSPAFINGKTEPPEQPDFTDLCSPWERGKGGELSLLRVYRGETLPRASQRGADRSRNSMYSPIPQSSPFPPTVKLPGLHIWRVEKLKPVPVAPENYGIFFSGDSYLVLHNGPEELSHLHLWIGQQSSRDEQGGCAILAVHLNTLLGERPVQHRESQGNESDLFMSYFPHGLKYQVRTHSPRPLLWLLLELLPAGRDPAKGPRPLRAGASSHPVPACLLSFLPSGRGHGVLVGGDGGAHLGWPSGLQEGGVESAFHKTSPGSTPAAIKKLYQVKGKKNIRATERMLSWDSFNTGDCFILDLGQVSGQG